MKVIKIDKTEFNAGLDKLEKTYRLYGPVREKQYWEYKKLDKGEKPELGYTNTRLSAKSLLYPQSEVTFEYSLDKSAEDYAILQEPEKDYSPRAVIGIRPCDADAYAVVRRNFETPEYQDYYWLNNYHATTLVGLACNTPPSATCFCTSAGSGPFNDANLDILLVDNGDHYLARVMTGKGERLTESAGWTITADGADATIDNLEKEAETKIASSVQTDRLKDQSLIGLYEAETDIWEKEAFACINCGTCTFACPTCWCFDVQDENYGKSGVRMRNWDSCMFPLFTIHASGHNPRGQKLSRIRQRFMHKLKYYVDKYDKGIQCTGCGRCVRLCPVNIDIRRVCNQMNSYDPKSCSCEATS